MYPCKTPIYLSLRLEDVVDDDNDVIVDGANCGTEFLLFIGGRFCSWFDVDGNGDAGLAVTSYRRLFRA